MNIQMVDLKGQYEKIKEEIDLGIADCINSTQFIKGPKVSAFQDELAKFLDAKHVITCANGTDALQIALMALNLNPGDEVIIPAFTYVATAEVIGLLRLTPVLVDVYPDTFNINIEEVKKAITPKTKAIVPVHLFGQGGNMEELLKIAQDNNLVIVEDNAQAIGADYTFSSGKKQKLGTIGNIGCTSFFPSKNLGCYGDGGALMTNDSALAEKIRMIANHGQPVQYTHDIIGVNSRLDAIQAAVLLPKLKRLDDYSLARINVANYYDQKLKGLDELVIPCRYSNSTHVFHQYTLKVKNGKRDSLKEYLKKAGIPSMVYYPKPLHHQNAYKDIIRTIGGLSVSVELTSEVLSLPIHTEMNIEQLEYITETIIKFYRL